jgi:hypothetical protein
LTTALDDLPTWLLAILVIGGCTGFVVGLQFLLRDTVKASMRDMHNEVAGYVFAAVGVLYALLLGFVILASWEHVGAAETDVQREAASLTALNETSVGLPDGMRQTAQAELRRYTSLVINDEWSAMAHGHSSPKVDASLDRLYQIYASGGRAGVQDNVDNASLQLLNEIGSARAERLSGAAGSLDGIFWAVVFFGGICTLAFALLFYLENAGIHIAMIAILAALISSMLFLLVVLDHPFSGDFHVSSEAFRLALEHMHA